jgi:YD repeat-containing protein
LQTVSQSGNTLASYGYDSAGRLASIARLNGTTSSYSYDGADRLTELKTLLGSSLRSDFSAQPDRLG